MSDTFYPVPGWANVVDCDTGEIYPASRLGFSFTEPTKTFQKEGAPLSDHTVNLTPLPLDDPERDTKRPRSQLRLKVIARAASQWEDDFTEQGYSVLSVNGTCEPESLVFVRKGSRMARRNDREIKVLAKDQTIVITDSKGMVRMECTDAIPVRASWRKLQQKQRAASAK